MYLFNGAYPRLDLSSPSDTQSLVFTYTSRLVQSLFITYCHCSSNFQVSPSTTPSYLVTPVSRHSIRASPPNLWSTRLLCPHPPLHLKSLEFPVLHWDRCHLWHYMVESFGSPNSSNKGVDHPHDDCKTGVDGRKKALVERISVRRRGSQCDRRTPSGVGDWPTTSLYFRRWRSGFSLVEVSRYGRNLRVYRWTTETILL